MTSPVQTTYTQKPSTDLFPGQIADHSNVEADAKRNSESSANMPFGIGVVADTADGDACKLPTSATATFLGVTVFEHNRNGTLANSDAIQPSEMVNVGRKGRFAVISETAITSLTLANRTVRMRIAGTGQKGGFRVGAVSGETVLLTGVRFNKTCLAAGVTEIEISDSVTMTAD